jgi:hypothetical protein
MPQRFRATRHRLECPTKVSPYSTPFDPYGESSTNRRELVGSSHIGLFYYSGSDFLDEDAAFGRSDLEVKVAEQVQPEQAMRS